MVNNPFLQKYKLLNVLEYGAFSTVHLAVNQKNNEKYIIKEIIIKKSDLAKNLEVFEREAKVLENIKHNNIPRFIEYFKNESENETIIYLVQEYIEGNNLANLIKEHHFFNEENALEIVLDICNVLEYLHSFSPPVIHRDIKPENIIYSNQGKSYLIDFGAVIDEFLHEKMKIQGLSTIIGTQSYMPFEQMRGQAVRASDIYSLGLSLIFILSHKAPYQIASKGLNLDFKPFVNISKNFYKIIKKMVDPDWEKRYQNATDLKNDILKILNKPAKNNSGKQMDNFSPVENIEKPFDYKNPVNKQNTDLPEIKQNSGSRFAFLENIENLENVTEILKKIAGQENLAIREQQLLIAVTVNKISVEEDKNEIITELIKNRYLRNEIINTLVTSICQDFSNEFIKGQLLIKLIANHQLSTSEQNHLLIKVFSKIQSEDIITDILQALSGYRFLNDEILAALINKIGSKLKNENTKVELFIKIIAKHHLSVNEQKLFIEIVLDYFLIEVNKALLLKIFIEKQYPNKNINLFITEQIKIKIASEANRQTILNGIKI
jgi:serine/threonine protein kinase